MDKVLHNNNMKYIFLYPKLEYTLQFLVLLEELMRPQDNFSNMFHIIYIFPRLSLLLT